MFHDACRDQHISQTKAVPLLPCCQIHTCFFSFLPRFVSPSIISLATLATVRLVILGASHLINSTNSTFLNHEKCYPLHSSLGLVPRASASAPAPKPGLSHPFDLRGPFSFSRVFFLLPLNIFLLVNLLFSLQLLTSRFGKMVRQSNIG